MSGDAGFHKLKQVWETLGNEDPLWAVVSHPDKRGGRWDVSEFLATGEADVRRCHALMEAHGRPPSPFRHILDFGCGVGRLSLAWSRFGEKVTGVDISGPMIRQARRLSEGRPGVEFVINPNPDLKVFEGSTFDLCVSHICLQHMPWTLARGYLAEFVRVCAPGGWIVFQLPSRPPANQGAARFRKRLVDALPLGLDRVYRRWRNGSSTVFDVYYTSREEVLGSFAGLDVEAVHQEPDDSAGPHTEGFIYLFRKAR